MVKSYKVYTVVCAKIFLVACALSAAAQFPAWWTVNETADSAALGLKTSKLMMNHWLIEATLVKDGGNVLLGQEVTEEKTWKWDEFCKYKMELSENREEPPSCMQVKFLQMFSLIVPICSFLSMMFFYVSLCTSKLVIILGLLAGAIASFAAIISAGFAVLMQTQGLSDMGFAFFAVSTFLTVVGTFLAMQTANTAMPEPKDAPAAYLPRTQRADAAKRRGQEEADARDQRMGPGGRGPGSARSGSQRSGSRSGRSGKSASEDEKEPPVYLQKVLFWSRQQDPGDPSSQQSIPTELLEMAFQEIDEDNSGFIVVDELVEALHLCGLNAHPKAVDRVIQDMDKNASGDIDITEFVEFFRQMEELSQFYHKTQARQQFCTMLCNFCFLLNLIVVFVLIMIFVGMDQNENPDMYQITRTLLMAMLVALIVLCCCVIGFPAMRLSIGRQVSGWIAYWEHAQIEKLTMKPVQGSKSDVELEKTAEALRQAGWGQAEQAQSAVDARQTGSLFRPGADQGQLALTSAPPVTTLAAIKAQAGVTRKNAGTAGAIVDEGGNFIRYDPSAYSRAAIKAAEVQQPRSFNPMQAHAVEELQGNPDFNPVAVKALPEGTTQWSKTPWIELEDTFHDVPPLALDAGGDSGGNSRQFVLEDVPGSVPGAIADKPLEGP
jgi:hypothetical protein